MNRLFALDEIHVVAKDFLQQYAQALVIAFHGDLGAGKTTFVRAVCNVKGVHDAVSSPTFSIINEYQGTEGKIYHIDLYRLKDELEVLRAGVEDCLYSGDLCLVEWPERAAALFPPETVHVFLEVVGQTERRIVIRDN
ncbi:MAG: tRNA (adenosine(37)-N6)-threonylcarbamoyltransferase complex ATPase subunit type 1 TsaE [Williamsia sp.]|nr:tRNA (adenosine(37)-N6)-threonylcarbamoyltransferase complex ATPase subunit type 1 TsaE [Williamsia sp.]